ncbi:hypothetical protein L6452_42930 [Arctium lappa]|uniref:Uncharacterized protein n=1 Tax=Arctium lappa TaxID=4217 RepID=A0ACB8XLD3_ARCLA|nr:hypothetical protein L6452_42930 [Arctium lappa]
MRHLFVSSKEPQFPVLAAIARDILTIQASTVASESAFSFIGKIISARRTRLTLESVECCMCLQDYLDNMQRIQDQTSLEADIDDMEANLAENEVDQGLSMSPTVTDDDASSVDGVSHYDDEEEELNVDHLDDNTAVDRLEKHGTLHEYNDPYYNYNPWGWGGGSSGSNRESRRRIEAKGVSPDCTSGSLGIESTYGWKGYAPSVVMAGKDMPLPL